MIRLFKILPIILMTLFTSCGADEQYLFWIEEPGRQENDFLFMAESTNVLPIGRDSLSYYLTKEEIGIAEKLTFKNFGVIHENENYRAIALLKEGSDPGRDYTFIIRTFDQQFKIIGSYELAKWMDFEQQYCFGSINTDLVIRRTCAEGKETDAQQIGKDGRIVAISYEKNK